MKTFGQGKEYRRDESIFFCGSEDVAGARNPFILGYADQAGRLGRPEIRLPFLETDFCVRS